MYLRLLTWSLRHRRWRHALNGVAMAVTVAVVMVFVSVLVDLLKFVDAADKRGLTRVMVNPKIGPPGGGGLPYALLPTLKSIDGAEVVHAFIAFGGRHDSGATYGVFGEEDGSIDVNQDILPVTPEVTEAWKKEPLGAIVTDVTARELGLEVGKVAEIPTGLGPLQIKVVGLSYKSVVVRRVVIHFKYAQEFVGKADLLTFRVFCKPENYARVAREIAERTAHSPTPAHGINAALAAASWAKQAAIVPALLGFLGIFLVCVTAMTLANSCAIAIRERRTEIATLRVLGFRRGLIVRLLLGETLVVGIAGGLVAVAATWFLFQGAHLIPASTQLSRPIAITPVVMLIGLFTAIAIPLAGAFPSARAAVRAPLVEALRDTA
jgi:putative ABC transport system permease protein